jgi:LAS superfamily LD-carboxypeptidase LdcB
MFACAFLALAAIYGACFYVTVWTDADAAASRFAALSDGGYPGAAEGYGERVIALRRKDGVSEEDLAAIKAQVAASAYDARKYDRSAALFEEALASKWAENLGDVERALIEDKLARSRIIERDIARAVSIYTEFLDLSGDVASRTESGDEKSLQNIYANLISASGTLFTEALKPTGNPEYFSGAREAKLSAANDLTKVGAFFALKDDGLYASAGLLSSALAIRKEILGADHPDTVQIALVLGPVYERMGRLEDAEKLYLDAFHAQEKAKGSNSPELSLYIKLLAGVYEAQGRATEAQALNEHMRALFRDAFGAQRYAANRVRDRKLDIDRPVSQQFPLAASYAPTDLVRAVSYSIPLSKNADVEEMSIRLAADSEEDAREANMPVRLAQLMSLCRADSGERISLRSGYRAYTTQSDLYARIGDLGTVTPPGISEHQLGLAADIDVAGRLMRQSDRTYQCFEENAFRFGFILSYPPGNNYLPGKDTYEPWHWRYVGIRTAQLYREAGPSNRPQEFLAALPCYQQRAVSSALSPAGEPDICLEEPKIVAANATHPFSATLKERADQPSARKLNNLSQSGQR